MRDPQGKFKPQALLSTDLGLQPTQIVEWYVLRWGPEVTFEEARRHLGVETQRQWSQQAICLHHARSAGALLAGDAAGAPPR